MRKLVLHLMNMGLCLPNEYEIADVIENLSRGKIITLFFNQFILYICVMNDKRPKASWKLNTTLYPKASPRKGAGEEVPQFLPARIKAGRTGPILRNRDVYCAFKCE